MASCRLLLKSFLCHESKKHFTVTMRLWNHRMLFKTSTRWIHRHSSFDKQFYDHIGKIYKSANERTVIYVSAIAVGILGLSYAAVPLYRLYCQASGYGGTVSKAEAGVKIEQMSAVRDRELLVKFSSSTSAGMQWQFKPHQKEIRIVPGETALAFYSAKNPTDRPITGIATYNVIPFDAGQYFNKIQCFCFEEQRLNPGEEVDMPVFFYIDPEFNEDPALSKVDTLTLSYTFFEQNEALNAPIANKNS